MIDPRWAEIERLFGDALEHPENERESFVRASGSDHEVAEEVLALLAAHERTGLFDPVTERTDHVSPAALDPGVRLGSWEVVGELGRGGMGVVYRVRRADGQYEQEGALKILPTESRRPDARTRFREERQILARLSHPRIARLLDGGVSEDGRPWFVMERVDGQRVDAFCDARGLDATGRLRLFIQVCDAVQYAHQNLIVHRDIKPGNILVTGEGEPHLLDFGIAKILDDELASGDREATQLAHRLLTPDYASPEQFRGDPVTPASDVYQLGLLLQRLMAGEESGGGAGPLRGDLQAILQKAIRPEPGERYGTAGQLGEDVQRYLEGRPVRAVPDTWRYVARKFVRRHVVPLAGTAGAFLLVAGLALGMRQQAKRTVVERDRAEQVIGLLLGLFQSADPAQALGDSVTVRAVLDRGAVRVRDELADQPAVRMSLLSVIGEVYASLGLRTQAVELLREAVQAGASAQDPDQRQLFRARWRLGMFLAQAGDFTAADSVLTAVEAQIAAGPPLRDDDLAEVLNDVGHAWQIMGSLDRAEPLLERALEVSDRVPGRTVRQVATLTNLGWIRGSRGDLDSAEVLFRRGLEIRRDGLPPGDPALAASLEALAWALTRKGSLAEADSAIGEALEIRRQVLAPDHSLVVGLLAQRASILRLQGENGEAEQMLRDVLRARIRALGADHFVVASTRNDLGLTLQAEGRDREAEPYFRSAWQGYRNAFGPDHVNAAISEANLARALLRLGENEEAAEHLEHLVPILREAYPEDRRFMGDAVSLGWLRCGAGGAHDVSDLREVSQALGEGEGAGSDEHLRALNVLASCLEGQGRSEEALAAVQSALDASAARPDTDPYRSVTLEIEGRLTGR